MSLGVADMGRPFGRHGVNHCALVVVGLRPCDRLMFVGKFAANARGWLCAANGCKVNGVIKMLNFALVKVVHGGLLFQHDGNAIAASDARGK